MPITFRESVSDSPPLKPENRRIRIQDEHGTLLKDNSLPQDQCRDHNISFKNNKNSNPNASCNSSKPKKSMLKFSLLDDNNNSQQNHPHGTNEGLQNGNHMQDGQSRNSTTNNCKTMKNPSHAEDIKGKSSLGHDICSRPISHQEKITLAFCKNQMDQLFHEYKHDQEKVEKNPLPYPKNY